jgi:hypothetical protein
VVVCDVQVTNKKKRIKTQPLPQPLIDLSQPSTSSLALSSSSNYASLTSLTHTGTTDGTPLVNTDNVSDPLLSLSSPLLSTAESSRQPPPIPSQTSPTPVTVFPMAGFKRSTGAGVAAADAETARAMAKVLVGWNDDKLEGSDSSSGPATATFDADTFSSSSSAVTSTITVARTNNVSSSIPANSALSVDRHSLEAEAPSLAPPPSVAIAGDPLT